MEIAFWEKVTNKDRAFVCRQLATMLSSGLPLDRAMTILSTQSRKTVLKDALEAIDKDIESGQKFSAAIAKYPKIFNKVFINIVVSGEAVGKLSEVLSHLADQLEKENSFNGKIQSAMLYPIFILLAMVGVMILMMVKVIPQLTQVFAESGAQLPWSTRLLIWVSKAIIDYWWLMLAIIAGLIVSIRLFIASEFGGLIYNKIQVNLPGGIGKDLYMSRFTRTLGMLVQAGTPIIEAVKITAEVMDNRIYRKSLLEIASQLERGIPMSVPIEKDPYFPLVVPQMILVGEQTGRIDQILNNLANYYENQTDDKIKGISSLFEPALIVIIGIGIGFVVYSIIGPIYGIAQLQ